MTSFYTSRPLDPWKTPTGLITLASDLLRMVLGSKDMSRRCYAPASWAWLLGTACANRSQGLRLVLNVYLVTKAQPHGTSGIGGVRACSRAGQAPVLLPVGTPALRGEHTGDLSTLQIGRAWCTAVVDDVSEGIGALTAARLQEPAVLSRRFRLHVHEQPG